MKRNYTNLSNLSKIGRNVRVYGRKNEIPYERWHGKYSGKQEQERPGYDIRTKLNYRVKK